jgi:hypothetical protein
VVAVRSSKGGQAFVRREDAGKFSKGGATQNPGNVDHTAAEELDLYAENDSQLYRKSRQPIEKNLILKMAKGRYDPDKAVKLWSYFTTYAARKYGKEFGSSESDGLKIFNAPTRIEAAKKFARRFETEAKLGSYDHLLPEKYRAWRVKSNPTPVKIRTKTGLVDGVAKRIGDVVKVFVPAGVLKKNPEIGKYAGVVPGKYHPGNPKIDLYVDGKYVASTQWYKTVRDAVASIAHKYPGRRVYGEKAKKNPHRKLSKYEASKILNRLKISVPEDFHALSRGQVDGLLEEADNIGYKRPASASGSKARYFHAYLQRLASSKGR